MIVLPPPRPLLWALRSRETAKVQDRLLADRRRRITIRHALLRGVTPEMLNWWYRNIEGEMDYAGGRWPRYCVWHPLDHIAYTVSHRVNGEVRPGTRLHIREAFQRQPENLLDLQAEVDSIEPNTAIIQKRVGPLTVLRLANRFDEVAGGTRYVTEMTIGAAGLAGRVLNALIRGRILAGALGQAWIRHHIEEIGMLERFLPDLYASEHPER
jgi:hypothetical protein